MYGVLMAVAFLAAGGAAAENIYRWTDDSGQVHYGSRPGADNAREVTVNSTSPKSEPSALSDQERRTRQQRLLESYERDRELKQEQAQRQAEQQQKVDKACRDLQDNWRWLNHPGPIYLRGENGARAYLDEATRQQQKAKVRQQIDQYCK